MIVVAIIGILSAVAIPSFMRYMAKAKTSEVVEQLEKIAGGARIYYMDIHHAKSTGTPLAPQFPVATALTPAASCCSGAKDRCTPQASDWADPTWQALSFSMDDPHYYRYEFDSSGVGASAEFTARAYGDLDCDSTFSTFERYGWVQVYGNDVSVQSGVYREKSLE